MPNTGYFLPTGLTHSWDLAFKSKLAEHDAGDAELAVYAPGTPGKFAPTHMACWVLWSPVTFGDLTFTSHWLDPLSLLLFFWLLERHPELGEHESAQLGIRFAEGEVDVHAMCKVLFGHVDLGEYTLLSQAHRVTSLTVK